MLVDLTKLDALREVIDVVVAETAIVSERRRSDARYSVAASLGFELESEERDGWWFASGLSYSEEKELQRAFHECGWVAAVRQEFHLRFGRCAQARTCEDAETAVLLRLLDEAVDLQLDPSGISRIYGVLPKYSEFFFWQAWVEFKWDGTERPSVRSMEC